MILTNLQHNHRYQNINPHFSKLFNFLKDKNLSSLPLGRIDIDGENVFINVVELQGKAYVNLPMEAHQQYIDVHILVEGTENIGYLPIEKAKILSSSYNNEDDYVLYTDKPSTLISLQPGDMMILFPEDAHVPAIGEGKIKKLIAKVHV